MIKVDLSGAEKFFAEGGVFDMIYENMEPEEE